MSMGHNSRSKTKGQMNGDSGGGDKGGKEIELGRIYDTFTWRCLYQTH